MKKVYLNRKYLLTACVYLEYSSIIFQRVKKKRALTEKTPDKLKLKM